MGRAEPWRSNPLRLADAPRDGQRPGVCALLTPSLGSRVGAGPNDVHGVASAKQHMQLADLVVVWGSSLSVLANYFDPWHPGSRWAKPPPAGLRLAPPPAKASPKSSRRTKPRPCLLAVVSRGDVLDQELATIKIDDDVDGVAAELLQLLGVPPPPEYEPAADPFVQQAVAPFPGEPAAPWTIDAALGLARGAGNGRDT